jgi:hypothetical protein
MTTRDGVGGAIEPLEESRRDEAATTAFIFAVIQRLIHARFDGADNFLL